MATIEIEIKINGELRSAVSAYPDGVCHKIHNRTKGEPIHTALVQLCMGDDPRVIAERILSVANQRWGIREPRAKHRELIAARDRAKSK